MPRLDVDVHLMHDKSVLHELREQIGAWANGAKWSGKTDAQRFLASLPQDPPDVVRWIAGLKNLGSNNSRLLWRLRSAPHRSEANQSPEKILEKLVAARLAQFGWANQVATASGLSRSRGDSKRNIDLIKLEGDGAYRFVELKIASNNPVYAAVELLEYSILYLWWRGQVAGHIPGREDAGLMNAKVITLEVLAPSKFYQPYDPVQLGRLGTLLESGLRNYAKDAPIVHFRYSVMPEGCDKLSSDGLRKVFDRPEELAAK